jgi:hypothetical protein
MARVLAYADAVQFGSWARVDVEASAALAARCWQMTRSFRFSITALASFDSWPNWSKSDDCRCGADRTRKLGNHAQMLISMKSFR